jgi:hypothetical protein
MSVPIARLRSSCSVKPSNRSFPIPYKRSTPPRGSPVSSLAAMSNASLAASIGCPPDATGRQSRPHQRAIVL